MRDMIFESSEQGVALEGILDEPSATPRGLAVIAHRKSHSEVNA